MYRARTHAATIIAALYFAIASLVGPSFAQSAKDLAGSYTLVSAVMDLNGKKSDTYGPNAKGTLTLDANGRFVMVFMRASLPRFASNNRMTGTPAENQAIVQGSFASFGTYSVSEADKTIIFHIDNATFSNFNGDEKKEQFYAQWG